VKLLNFGSSRVEGILLRNALEEAERHQHLLRDLGWRALSPQCGMLVERIRDLVCDWGTHLSTQLYNEALVHFFGGEGMCLSRIEVIAGDRFIGSHPVQMLSPGVAFAITGFHSNQISYRRHLEAVLEYTRLEAIQWINLDRSTVEITTLEKNGRGMRAGK
jgi:hypothetical protein